MSKAERNSHSKNRFSGRKAVFLLLGLALVLSLAAWHFHFSKAPRVAQFVDCIEAHQQHDDAHECMENKELLHKVSAYTQGMDMQKVARSSVKQEDFHWLNNYNKLPEDFSVYFYSAFDGLVAVLNSEEPIDIVVIVDRNTNTITGYYVARE